MESRHLKLHIAKGPREGDEVEFKPGSRIRIGRVVRGNNVAIKDAGISSKHLSIELDPRSGTWILQDLGSSNGTFINGSSAVLSPNTPYTISDGDTIKIGESTSIIVKLDSCGSVQLPQNPTRRRRGASRRNLEEATTGVLNEKLGLKEAEEIVKDAGFLKENGVDLASTSMQDTIKIGESASILVKLDSCGAIQLPQNPTRRRRAASRRNLEDATTGVLNEKLGLKEAEEIVKDAGFLKESGVDLASTSMKEVENIDPEKERIAQFPRVSPRRTRGRNRKVEDGIGTNNNCEEAKNDLGNRPRASTRRKRNEEKDVEKLNPVVVAADNVNVEVSNLEEETGQPDEVNNDKLTVMGIGRIGKVEDGIGRNNNCEEAKNDLGKRTRASTRRKRNEEKDVEKLNPVVVAADNVNVEVSNLEEETGQPDELNNDKLTVMGNEAAANGHADVGNSDLCAEGKNGPSLDLAKLTLREWFDYVEVYLPKQIVDETEKSLATMREKVERIKDYVKEQRKKN